MSAVPREGLVEVTEADIRKFAPKARPEYVAAILANLSEMRSAGILETPLRWCHFMGQCGHETGGFRVIRESLDYRTLAALRRTWPARFRNTPDAELKLLLGNPIALGDRVYMGRMGNHLPGHGYEHRGAGILQCTGRAALVRYCRALGLDPNPELLNDVGITTRFAILEWSESGANKWADENDILRVSRVINVGSSERNVTPVNFEDRKKWFAKAWSIWGEEGKPDVPVEPQSTKKLLVKVGLPAGGGGALGGAAILETFGAFGRQVADKGIPKVPEVATRSIENAQAWKGLGRNALEIGQGVSALAATVGRLWPVVLIMGACTAGLIVLKLRGAK